MKRRFPFFTWARLRALGNSRAVQFSAVFPFVGYWIIFNDQLSQFLSIGQLDQHTLSASWLELAWSTKLYFLYFGLLLLGIGSFIYQAACPYILKKHADWAEYVRSDSPVMDSDRIRSLEKILEIPDHATRDLGWDQKKSVVLQRWYADQSASRSIARLLVGLLFYIGLILLAVPATVSFFKIALSFASKVYG